MSHIIVKGRCGITARVVEDSVSGSGIRLTTMLVDKPRIVHAEMLKHRMFSISAASSRAIPFAKMKDQLSGKPVRFGEANTGMQDKGKDFDAKVLSHYKGVGTTISAEEAWEEAKISALWHSEEMNKAGLHKQVYNRLSEPFQMIRVLITATEWSNFWWLRNDKDADPTLHETARVMQEAYESSKPTLLKAGEWHLPFVAYFQEAIGYTDDDEHIYGPRVFHTGTLQCQSGGYGHSQDFKILTLDEAIKVSAARSAAQSFRNTDYGLDKSLQVFDRLVNGDKIHAGALEHQATPMSNPEATLNDGSIWQNGVSHMDKNGDMWSGNFKHWVQFRKTIEGENHAG